jgi:hypothetical protein
VSALGNRRWRTSNTTNAAAHNSTSPITKWRTGGR